METERAPVKSTLAINCDCGATLIMEIEQMVITDPVKPCAICGVVYVVACSIVYVYQKEE